VPKNYTCAVWYYRYHSPRYELFETEQDAAEDAYYMTETGECSVSGVQFADGRTVSVKEWQAYADVVAAAEAEREASARAAEAPTPQPVKPARVVTDPFGGIALDIRDGDPDWLGR